MDFRQAVEELKRLVSADVVKAKIEADLSLTKIKNKYVCFLHNDDTNNPNMSFDNDKKRFHCFRCDQNYDIFNHYMSHYNLGFVDAVKKINDDFNLNVKFEDVKPQKKVDVKKHSEPKDVVLEYIYKRKITDSTINYVGLKGDGKNVVFEYKDQYGTHIANKYRPAKKISKGENKNWWDGEGKNFNALYNMDKVDITKPLVICEGEFDCLSLIESGCKNAVSVPAGARSYSWIEQNYDWLMQFPEIIIWFDNDNAGKEGINVVANRLDNCTKVVYSTKAKDINEILYKFGKEEVLNELNNAKSLDVDGVLTVSEIEDFNVYDAEKIKTGISLIDKYCLGFVMGSLVILTGYNGSGKSTILNQMCIAESLSQGYKVFAFSGELTPSNFKYWLYNTIADDCDIEEKQTKFFETYYKVKTAAVDNITNWVGDSLFLYNKMNYSEDEILKTMKKLAKRKGVRVFIIDNLMKVELEDTQHNELIAQRKFVNKLKMFALKYNALVYLVAHPRKPQTSQNEITKFDVSGSADITNLADYVLAIARVSDKTKSEHPEELDSSLYLLKDRPTGTSEKKAALNFSKKRRRFYIHESELNKQYGYLSNGEQAILDEIFPF